MAFEPTSKRRKGYPSETEVKRGQRIVRSDKELQERLGTMTHALADRENAFKRCCHNPGRFDGSPRGHYF